MQNTKADIEPYHHQLRRLFVYYCSYADKDNLSTLKGHNFRKYVNDLHLP